ncbi:MAG: response regulator [Phycisphaerae bacterium]|jgi:DNA-binding NtrC family response regulator
MLVLVRANVLVVGLVGLEGRSKALKRLPIRVSYIETGVEAGRSLKNESVDSVISQWELPDCPDGRFLKNLRLAKPYLPVIAIVNANDVEQEIAARSIGVAAVLSSDVTDDVLIQTVGGVLGLGDTEEIQKLCAVADGLDHRHV